MPYPRIHITNVRGHGIPPCPLCVFFPPQGMRVLPRNARNPQKFRVRVLPQNTLRRVWHPCHTHAAHLIILPQMAQISTDG